MTTRRDVCRALLQSCGAARLPFWRAPVASESPVDFRSPELWRHVIASRESARTIGRTYLASLPEPLDATMLIARLVPSSSATGPVAGSDALKVQAEMVARVHDPQHAEAVSTLWMIGIPTRAPGSLRAQDATQTWPRSAWPSPADGVGAQREAM